MGKFISVVACGLLIVGVSSSYAAGIRERKSTPCDNTIKEHCANSPDGFFKWQCVGKLDPKVIDPQCREFLNKSEKDQTSAEEQFNRDCSPFFKTCLDVDGEGHQPKHHRRDCIALRKRGQDPNFKKKVSPKCIAAYENMLQNLPPSWWPELEKESHPAFQKEGPQKGK